MIGNLTAAEYNKNKDLNDIVIRETVAIILNIIDLSWVRIVSVTDGVGSSAPGVRKYVYFPVLTHQITLQETSSISVKYLIRLVLNKYPVGNPLPTLSDLKEFLTSTISYSVSSGEFEAVLYNVSSRYHNSMLLHVNISVIPQFSFTVSQLPYHGPRVSPIAIGTPGFDSLISIGGFCFVISVMICVIIYLERRRRREKDALIKKYHADHVEAHGDAFGHHEDEEILEVPSKDPFRGLAEDNVATDEISIEFLATRGIEMSVNKASLSTTNVLPNPHNRNSSTINFTTEENSSAPQKTDMYSGSYEDGKRDGFGVMLYANGNRYEGEVSFIIFESYCHHLI